MVYVSRWMNSIMLFAKLAVNARLQTTASFVPQREKPLSIETENAPTGRVYHLKVAFVRQLCRCW
jgi:hypothetical protein